MSVKLRITLVTALLLLFLSIVVTIYTLRAQQAELRRESVRRVELALSMLSEMSSPALSIGDVLVLADVADRAARGQPERVVIADVRGIVLVDSRHELYDRHLPAIDRVVRTRRPYIGRTDRLWEGAEFVRDYRGLPEGVVYVAFSARPADAASAEIVRRVAVFALVLTGIGTLIAYLLGFYFSRALAPILSAIRRTEAGDFDVSVPETGTTELDEIGQSFERMTSLVGSEMRNLTTLNRLATDLMAAGTLQQFANLLRDACRALVDGKALLLFGDPRTGIVELAGAEPGKLATTSTDAAFLAVNERRAMSIGEHTDMDPGNKVAGTIAFASGVIAPLITPYRTAVGAVAVEFDPSLRPSPDRQDETAVMAVANLAAPILTMLAQTWTQQEAVAALTEILVPEEVPQPEGLEVFAMSEPAEVSSGLGGDYFDVLELGEGRWGVAIGDVSGKGLEAGRYTAMTKYVVRSFALEYEAPAETISHANVALSAQMEEMRFVTLFYCVVDTKSQALTYCCAGHLPGLLYSAATDEITELEAGGGFVGSAPEMVYTDERVEMRPGDIVVLYTDGVIEARHNRDEYGLDRLQAMIRANSRKSLKNMGKAIVEDVRTFAENVLRDDLTMVLLRLAEPPEEGGE